MDIERTGNLFEAGLWGLIALIIALRAIFERREVPNVLVILAVAFVVFGASDIVEARTGAWWHPWWLLGWKAACVLTFVFCLWKYYSLRKR